MTLLRARLLGDALQRGRLCFASAFRDLFLNGSGQTMRAVLAGLMVATLGFGPLMARMVPDPTLGLLPPKAHVPRNEVDPETVGAWMAGSLGRRA